MHIKYIRITAGSVSIRYDGCEAGADVVGISEIQYSFLNGVEINYMNIRTLHGVRNSLIKD